MFKVGDRVVDLHYVREGEYAVRGPGAVVTIVNDNCFYVKFDGNDKTVKMRNYFDTDMILEEVYNSPLYKALKE